MKNAKPLIALTLAAAALTAFGNPAAAQKPTTQTPKSSPKPAVQKATVVIDGGYSPATVSVVAGKPAEITFVRKSAAGCDGELLIPALKVNKTLKQGEKTTIRFTPKKNQTLAFSCGMKMYKGQITAK